MKSSLPDVEVLDGSSVTALTLPTLKLREGHWTRLGSDNVLGDEVTEHTLSGLVEGARAAARAQGYATGWAEGRRAAETEAREVAAGIATRHAEAEARREAEHQATLATLAVATQRFEQLLAAACERVESYTTEIAVGLVEDLVGHELKVAEEPGLDAVRRGLALLPNEPVLRIRVSPENALSAEFAEIAPMAEIVSDPTLGRGDAVIEGNGTVVDARVSSALARVREVLQG